MSSSLYEIVELPNGDVALRQVGEKGDPLVSIRFSPESLYFLRGAKLEVAKAMIEAGLEAAGEMAEEESRFEMDMDPDSQILH